MCQSPCIESIASRDPYGIIAQYGSGAPANRTCCYHPDARIRLYAVYRETTISSGAWTEYRFEGFGFFGQPMTGSYETLTSAGASTLTQQTTTVQRDFSHTAVGQISAANCGAGVRFQAGGTNSGSATELCSGYRGSYVSIGATTRYELTIRIEVIDRGGTGCCSTTPPPVGACILPGPACSVMTQAACIAAGGTWQGPGTTCGGVGGTSYYAVTRGQFAEF